MITSSSFGSPSTGKNGLNWSESAEAIKLLGGWSRGPVKGGWGSRACSAWREGRVVGRPNYRRWSQALTEVHRQGNKRLVLNWIRRFGVDEKKKSHYEHNEAVEQRFGGSCAISPGGFLELEKPWETWSVFSAEAALCGRLDRDALRSLPAGMTLWLYFSWQD